MVTHDLRGPLNNINIIAKELQKQKALAKDSITDSYLLHLEKSSARLNNLVNGLLQYAEIGNSSKMESLNIKAIIQQVLADMSEQIKINNATIIVGEMPVLVGRPNDIHMLFQNLIHNALKFIAADRNPTVKINSEKTLGYCKFSVEDNGIGIPENEIDNIFNAFHRLHNQSEFEGSGIGLYGCKKIIDYHQGEIWIESNENIGSKFFFTISTNLVEHKTIS
jgi:signal transduction histidine kinase